MMGFRMLQSSGHGSANALNIAQLADSPISLWKLAANSLDSIGSNNFTGTAPTYNSTPLYTGGEGYADFGGSVNLQTLYSPFALNSFTVEFVVQMNVGYTNPVILDNNQNSGYSIQGSPSGIGAPSNAAVMEVGGITNQLYTNTSLPTAAPVLVTILYNSAGIPGASGKNAQVYVNGIDVTTLNTGNLGTPTYSSSSYLNLGSRNGTYGFIGKIAQLAFYAGNLSPTRIAAHASASGL